MTPEQSAARITELEKKNQRLSDLVRYKRHDLHSEDLISDEEYGELMQNPGAVSRLEGYDKVKSEFRSKLAELEQELSAMKLGAESEQKAMLVEFERDQLVAQREQLRDWAMETKIRTSDLSYDEGFATALWRLIKEMDRLAAQPQPKALDKRDSEQPRVTASADGVYVASRASIPERSKMWRRLRASGVNITSSWIDEAGPGQTDSLIVLWERIESEIRRSAGLIVYAEAGDFPLKGAYIEAGIAIGVHVPVYVIMPGVDLDLVSCRPMGSWIKHPSVHVVDCVGTAMRMIESNEATARANTSTETETGSTKKERKET